MPDVAIQESDARLTAKPDRAGKYLSFRLAGEEFAIRVLNVREIVGIQHVIAVPQTPPHIKGVINLRGGIIPVVDLRLKFGLKEEGYTDRTCIVVVRVGGPAGQLPAGVVVDSVTEVLNVSAADIEETPDLGQNIHIPFLLGMAKIKGSVKILLDIGQALAARDLGSIQDVMGSALNPTGKS